MVREWQTMWRERKNAIKGKTVITAAARASLFLAISTVSFRCRYLRPPAAKRGLTPKLHDDQSARSGW